MSIDIMNRILWREDLPMTEKFVGLILASMADDGPDFACYPAVSTVARMCGCSPRTVQNATKALEGKGLLNVLRRVDRSNYYVFRMENLPHVSRPRGTLKERRILLDREFEPDLFVPDARVQEIHPPPPQEIHPTPAARSGTGESPAPGIISEPSEESSSSDSVAFAPAAVPSFPDFLGSAWKALKAEHPAIADVRKLDDGIVKMALDRAKTHAREGERPTDVWLEVVRQIRASRFLTGRAAPGPGRDKPFTLSLGWLCRPGNFREVINGKYETRGDDRGYDSRTGERLGPTGQAVDRTVSRLVAARERGGPR
jgi:AraC-like DNA-binding protein